MKAAKLSLKTKQKPKKIKSKPWFDDHCKSLKKRLKLISKELNMNSMNRESNQLRFNYFSLKKKYKKLVKQKQRSYKENIFKKIKDLNPKCRNEFWTLLKQFLKISR